MKKLVIVVIIAAALIMGTNQYGPQLVQTALYHALSTKMQLRPQDIQIEASPGAKVLLGELDRVEIHGTQLHVGRLHFESLDCHLRDVTFSPVQSITGGHLSVLTTRQGDMTAVIDRSELRQYLIKRVEHISNADVSFEGDHIVVGGTVQVGGGMLTAYATMAGRIEMKNTKLMFIPSELSVEGWGMKYNSKRLDDVEVYDFNDLPLGIVPDRVTIDGDRLIIHGVVK